MNESFDEKLDLWINQFLDGELPSQQESELIRQIESDPVVRTRFEQLSLTHTCCQQAVDEVLKGSVTDIRSLIDQAAPRAVESTRDWQRRRSIVNFAAGIAAGLILAMAFQMAFQSLRPGDTSERSHRVAQSQAQGDAESQRDPYASQPWPPSEEVLRQVDWYNLTDSNGNEWLIERWRDPLQQPASYTGDF